MNPLESMIDREGFGKCLTEMGYTGVGVEVGVFKGEFSHSILKDWGGKLIGIDCYNQGTEFHLLYEAIKRNEKFVSEGRYSIFINDSVYGAELVSPWLDFAYIDAGHESHEVRNDIKAWYPKVKTGGLLCGHDYDKNSGGVHDAVDEFMLKNPHLRMIHKPCGSWFVIKTK